jgi:alkanesulfonate monooxygenase SsuD/methylene tetrahydromethanopterin reductase-like flavin-dependent oxidoreductase (luciferase family)
MEFGIFDHLDASGVPIQQLYRERLALVQQAESLGFTRYHVAEHHGTPLGLAPSPSVWVASVIQRTTTIRIGPLVYVLPLYTPLRLAEEIAQLDQLSGGRLEVGVGRGASPYELGFYGVDVGTTFDLYVESLAAITCALSTGRMTHDGAKLGHIDAPLVIPVAQQPYPPLWFASSNPQSAAWAGEQGMNLIGFGTGAGFRPAVDQYWQSWEAHKTDPSRLNAHVAEPRVGLGRQIVIAPTDDEAVGLVREAHATHRENFLKLWHENDDFTRDAMVDIEQSLSSGMLLAGSPATVRDRVRELIADSGINYLMCTFAFGSLSYDNAVRSMDLFATAVMPGLDVA